MSEIRKAVERLVDKHGGLRAAARVLDLDPGYLSRLRNGLRDAPSEAVLRKLGLRRDVTYRPAERRA